MRNTIRNILTSKGVRVEETSFVGSKMIDYCLPTAEHYSWENGRLMSIAHHANSKIIGDNRAF